MRQLALVLGIILTLGCGKKPVTTAADVPASPPVKQNPSTSPPATVGSHGPNPVPPVTDEQQAQGTWKVVRVEVPPGDPEPKGEQLNSVTMVVKSNLLSISSKKGREQYFSFTLDATRSPKQINFVESDATGTPRPKGETYLGIYKQDGDELIVASAIESTPKGYRPKDFKADLTMAKAPGQQHSMVVVFHLKK